MKKIFSVKDEFVNSRLDRWFRRNVCEVPQSLIEKIIRKGNIKVNNKKKRVLTNFRKTIKFLFIILILKQAKTKKLKRNTKLLKKNYPHHQACLLKTMKTLQ